MAKVASSLYKALWITVAVMVVALVLKWTILADWFCTTFPKHKSCYLPNQYEEIDELHQLKVQMDEDARYQARP